MPRREAEVEQRRHFDRLVQTDGLNLWLFVVRQFVQMRFAPGQQFPRRPAARDSRKAVINSRNFGKESG